MEPTTAQKETLVSLYRAGAPWTKMAREAGLTVWHAKIAIARLRGNGARDLCPRVKPFPPPPVNRKWTAEEKEAILALWTAGAQLGEIALKFSCTPGQVTSVLQYLRRKGATVPRRVKSCTTPT